MFTALVELLTGQEPIFATPTEEVRGLAAYFLQSMEEITAVGKLARRCLGLHGSTRPDMKRVAMELETIRASQGASSAIQEELDGVDYTVGDITATGSC
ncbi:hypothetical protein OIU85_010956 [Salix viminalis]|uniref:Uncharacterized protein n=1 Tax=Salix viminalis TaxID=40686 RepID=A0A9Q0NRS3_SALVM|nr:hypothetical protein OIU85_010956 [Salix viminalis]